MSLNYLEKNKDRQLDLEWSGSNKTNMDITKNILAESFMFMHV